MPLPATEDEDGKASLATLPQEIVEDICRHLPLQQRMLLTATCRGLWHHPGLLASPALWGDVDVAAVHPTPRPQARQASLQAWLARRRAGLRALQLNFMHGQWVHPVALLASLVEPPGRAAGADVRGSGGVGGLEDLQIQWLGSGSSYPLDGAAVASAAQHLSRLRCLTRLSLPSASAVGRLPPPFAALTRLARLELVQNFMLGESEPGAQQAAYGTRFEPLATLTGLTYLSLRHCYLSWLPPQLSVLRALATLDVGKNDRLGQRNNNVAPGAEGADVWEALGAAWAPLEGLPALRMLCAAGCGLDRLPPTLGTLPALEELDLTENSTLGDEYRGEAAFEPLLRLTGLTSLHLTSCYLQAVPQEVAALSRLAHLAFNQQGGILGVRSEAFQPLGELTSLTSLALDSLPLFDLPAQLRGLSALRALDVSSSGCLVDDAFESLLALCALPLTRLSLANGRLVRLPPLPPTLVELSFSMNYALGEARGEDFAPLQGLTQLTSLACAECGLSWLPDEISSLPALAALDCSGNRTLGIAGLRPLLPLHNLTRLNLSDCSLEAVPPSLPPRLADLQLKYNTRLNAASDDGLLTPLLHLAPTLTRLELGGCCRRPPRELSTLTSLQDLTMTGLELPTAAGQALGRGLAGLSKAFASLLAPPRSQPPPDLPQGGSGFFAPLLALRQLSQLHLAGGPSARSLPRELADLRARGVRVEYPLLGY